MRIRFRYAAFLVRPVPLLFYLFPIVRIDDDDFQHVVNVLQSVYCLQLMQCGFARRNYRTDGPGDVWVVNTG